MIGPNYDGALTRSLRGQCPKNVIVRVVHIQDLDTFSVNVPRNSPNVEKYCCHMADMIEFGNRGEMKEIDSL